MLGPDHDHRVRGVELTIDHVAEHFAGGQTSVPPHGEAFALEIGCELLGYMP